MKSFFKKVALLLVLAMVVTMLPAKAASAAEADGPQMYSTLRLYIGGDATETYSDSAYAKTWNKSGYDVVGGFSSDNEEVATVNDKGLVTAKSTGTATITAVFASTTGGESVTKTCKVTVKRNALEAGIGDGTATKLQNLVVGQKLQTRVYRSYLDEEGVEQKVWKGKDIVTDAVRYSSSDESVFKVTKRGGYVTAVGAGTAMLKVWPVQTEKAEYNEDGTLKEYRATAEPEEYTVTVVDPMDVKQASWVQFELTFPTEEEAKKAVDSTKPTVNIYNAPVSEARDVIKVYEELKNTNNEPVARYIRSVAQKATDPTVVVVTMFDELSQETTYRIDYLDVMKKVTTVKNVAEGIQLYAAEGGNLGDNQSYTIVGAQLYVTHKDGYRVILADSKNLGRATGEENNCKAYNGWQYYVEMNDTRSGYHVEYSFDNQSWRIDFFTEQADYPVELHAVLDDWNNVLENGTPNKVEGRNTFYPGDNSILHGQVISWGVSNALWDCGPDSNKWKEIANKTALVDRTLAANDRGFFLSVRAEVTVGGVTKEVYTGVEWDGNTKVDALENDKFTFKSANDDRLIINEKTGELYPSKESSNHVIYVYYDDVYIGSCTVKIIEERIFTSMTVETKNTSEYAQSNTKISFNPEVAGVVTAIDEGIEIRINPKDQLGASFYDSMSYEIQIVASDATRACLEVSNANKVLNNGVWEGKCVVTGIRDGYYYCTISANTNLDAGQTISFSVLCTATYKEGTNNEISRKYSTLLSARHTRVADERNYEIYSNNVDLAINTDDNTKSDYWDWRTKTATIIAYSYDKDGYTVQQLPIKVADEVPTNTPSGKEYTIVLQHGSKYVPVSASESNRSLLWESGTGVVTFRPISVDANPSKTYPEIAANGTVKVLSPAGEIVTSVAGHELTIDVTDHLLKKEDTGSYSIRLYVSDGASKPTYKRGRELTVSDSQKSVTWTWVNYSNAVSSYGVAVKNGLKVDYHTPLKARLYQLDWEAYLQEYAQINHDRLTVKKLSFLLEVPSNGESYYLRIDVPVMRSFAYRIDQ